MGGGDCEAIMSFDEPKGRALATRTTRLGQAAGGWGWRGGKRRLVTNDNFNIKFADPLRRTRPAPQPDRHPKTAAFLGESSRRPVYYYSYLYDANFGGYVIIIFITIVAVSLLKNRI